jgi:hypothetical protein
MDEPAMSVLEAIVNVPSYVVAPVFTFLGGLIGVFFGPRIKWGIEKKRELRLHRRHLIAQWQNMIGDVSRELDRLETKDTYYDLGDVLRILERHPDYASFLSHYDRYSNSGLRGMKLRFMRSKVGRKIAFLRKPRLYATPERIMMAGSHLPARLRLTIQQISEIERWWKLDK